LKKKVIIRIDGGICSQMFEYLLGFCFSHDTDVSFDLSAFNGKNYDLTNTYQRTFDLLKLFPYLNFKKANFARCLLYKGLYSLKEGTSDFESLNNSKRLYFYNGFSMNIPHEYIFVELFNRYFKLDDSVLDKKNIEFLKKIRAESESCAIHIRRGDLSSEEIAIKAGYGKICTIDYFLNSIRYLQEKIPGIKFYFFSDDKEYVQKAIFPLLNNTKYELVDINSNQDGFFDLYLIANCKHHISSLGSLGVYGALLNRNDGYYISTKRSYNKLFKNSILFDYQGKIIEEKVELK